MPMTAGIAAAGSAIGGIAGGLGSYFGSQANAKSIQAGIDASNAKFGVAQNALTPLINKGSGIIDTAFDPLSKLLTPGANMTDTLSQIPGFKFAQDWGQTAIKNMGSVTGLGGNTLKAGADYATGAASQTYGTIVNALQALLNSGGSIAGNASGALAGAATGAGAQQLQGFTNMGGAQGAGIAGVGNAIGGGIQSAGNFAALTSLFGGNKGGMFGNQQGTPGYNGYVPGAF